MNTHLHKDRTMGECIVDNQETMGDSQEKVGHVDM